MGRDQMTPEKAAEICEVHTRKVCEWLRWYRAEGVEGLADKQGQANWVENELPAIKKAIEEYGILMFEDETVFQVLGSISRTRTICGIVYKVCVNSGIPRATRKDMNKPHRKSLPVLF